jgi:hypothetical protein
VKLWFAVFVILLGGGCGATSSYMREHDVSANLPRAQGLGAFTPACIFLCFATTHFTHGDDTIDPNATEALMHSKMNVQAVKQGGVVTSQKGPKKPKGATP